VLTLLFFYLILPLYLIPLADDSLANMTADAAAPEESIIGAVHHFLLGDSEEPQGAGALKKANLRRRLLAVAGAPCSRFLVDMFSHFALLLVFSYQALNTFQDTFTPLEWLLLVWFVGLTLEELRQVLFTYPLTSLPQLRRNIGYWASSPWNLMDAIIVGLYVNCCLPRPWPWCSNVSTACTKTSCAAPHCVLICIDTACLHFLWLVRHNEVVCGTNIA